VSTYARAEALLDDLNRPELAEEELRRLLSANPEDGYAQTLLARALGEQDKILEAWQAMAAAMRLVPGDGYTHRVRGWLLEKQEEETAAKVAYREALRLDPTDVLAHQALARVLCNQGKYRAALKVATTALQIQPEHVGCLNSRALSLLSLGRYEEAETTLTVSLRIAPSVAETHAFLGSLWENRRRPQKALASYRTALELDPQLEGTRERIGFLLRKKATTLTLAVMFLVAAFSVLPLMVFLPHSERGRKMQKTPEPELTFGVVGAIGWWVCFGIRYPALRLALLNFTPWASLVASVEQRRRTYLLTGTMVLLTATLVSSWFGLQSPPVGWASLAVIFILGLPLMLTYPCLSNRLWRWRLAGAGLAAVCAAVAFLNYFLRGSPWGTWPPVMVYILLVGLLYLALYRANETQSIV
jgi:tetratricopeptide (TPR) repeat protein